MERPREPRDDEETFARDNFQPQTAQPVFKHSPLDLKAASIRLVRILPDLSSNGRVQLELRHASTESIYTCLSYVWGQEKHLRRIKLAGRYFQVRQNLHAFLESARKKPHLNSKWLWIDALCIDQSNNSERSHQVQQMGRIFGHAVRVISWLGDDEPIARYFRGSMPSLKLAQLNFFEGYHGDRRFLEWRFLQSDYWKRAWITQEVSLARCITFMAGKEEIDRWEEKDDVVECWTTRTSKWVNVESKAASLENSSYQWRGKSLIYLLQLFSEKDCGDRRDRVFSLLGLCGEGSDLEVDYDISHDELAKRVLQACGKSFCLCAVGILDRALHLAEPGPAGIEQQFFRISPSRPNKLYLDRKNSLLETTNRKEVKCGNPLDIEMPIDEMCRSYSGIIYMTIDPRTCHRVQHTDNESTLYYNDCDLVIRTKPKEIRSSHSWSVSYDRRAQTWHITFPFATLVQVARLSSRAALCKQGGDEDATPVEAYRRRVILPIGAAADFVEPRQQLVLRMSSGSDLYTDAPDLSIPTPEIPLLSPHQSLRSFEVRPYVDDHGQFRYCGVFVYDQEDSKDDSIDDDYLADISS
jgi:hypothetical protein